MGGYNGTGWNDPDQVQPFGSFVNLPDGVTQPENGTLYIEEFVPGSTFTITLQGTIPENYAKKDIAFCFAAVSYGKADFDPETDTPIMAAATSISGKVADKVTENPEPGTPGKDDLLRRIRIHKSRPAQILIKGQQIRQSRRQQYKRL